MQITTITQKGQVTVPVSIRNRWNIKPFEKIVFIETEDSVVIQPMKAFYSLRGSINSTKKYADKQADQSIKTRIAHEYEKETNSD